MPSNLHIWPNLQPMELLILLRERLGGTWQGNISTRRPSKLYIPMAGSTCRVILRFDGPKVISIERGEAFDQKQWEQISKEIEISVLAGPTRIGREYSFSGRRVTGSWQGNRSGVQIIPPPSNLPTVPTEAGDHPFILEFPIMMSGLDPLNNYRRLSRHRDLTLLLNILLTGGVKSMDRPTHFWAGTQWVKQCFSTPLNPYISGIPSLQSTQKLRELDPEDYEKIVGNDGTGLCVPSDLDQSISSYDSLSCSDRDKFDRAAFWFSVSSGLRHISMAASFTALVSAVESLTAGGNAHKFKCPVCGGDTDHRVPGPTKLFMNLLTAYAPGASRNVESDMYELRSNLVHGAHLVEVDREISFAGWTPPGYKEYEHYFKLWELTRTALRNWLKDRRYYISQARHACAYFHWIERGRPLWEADIDWGFAEMEYPL